MPQLDLLTLSVQVSAIIFFSWGLLITMLNLILPQYLLLNHSKKLLWFYLNNLIVKVKYYAFLTYAHGVIALSSFVKALLQKVVLLSPPTLEKLSKSSYSKRILQASFIFLTSKFGVRNCHAKSWVNGFFSKEM